MRKYYLQYIDNLIKQFTGSAHNYIVLNNTLTDLTDIQAHLEKIRQMMSFQKRLLIIYHNHSWEPFLKMVRLFTQPSVKERNWLDDNDVQNLLNLAGFEVITKQKRVLFPVFIPLLSDLLNKIVAHFPIVNLLCLTNFIVARKVDNNKKQYSVSIIVPARNEAGNIKYIPKSIPKFGKFQEIIFVEGNSSDETWKAINKLKNVKIFKQKGRGKADAVRLGFSKAKGDILMIYDADRTVDAKDLKKFYLALSTGKGEFINGSRLIYPMEKDAMRILNKIGNKFFSILFTWILGQRFKDTLCGTKAFFRKDYLNFRKFSDDPFGDFELIFGAIKNNLKVIEIPVRYKDRVYGATNINRFKHGLLLLKMTWIAFRLFKAR